MSICISKPFLTKLFSEFEFNKNDLLFSLVQFFIGGTFSSKQISLKNVHICQKKVVIKNPKGTPLGRFYCIVMSLWIGPAKHCICILICFYFLFCFAVMQIRDSSRYRFLFLVFLDNNICNNIMCQIFTRRLKIHILVSEQL